MPFLPYFSPKDFSIKVYGRRPWKRVPLGWKVFTSPTQSLNILFICWKIVIVLWTWGILSFFDRFSLQFKTQFFKSTFHVCDYSILEKKDLGVKRLILCFECLFHNLFQIKWKKKSILWLLPLTIPNPTNPRIQSLCVN